MKRIALAIILALAAPAAMAEYPANYWNIQLGGVSADLGDFGRQERPVATVAVGRELIPYLGLEARAGLARGFNSSQGSLKLEPFGSLFARINLAAGDVRPYLLLGGSAVKLVSPGNFSETETGFSGGIGISLHTGDAGVTFEYMRLIDKGPVLIHGVNIGLIKRF